MANQLIEVPISRRYYLIGSIFPLLGIAFLVPVYMYSEGAGRILFFGSFAAFLCLFSGLHLPYVFTPNKYSLKIGPDGITEHTVSSLISIDWCDIESIDLRAINSHKQHVTYRLRKKTIGRWFSFGKFDLMHRNQYAIEQQELLQIVSKAFLKYRSVHPPVAHASSAETSSAETTTRSNNPYSSPPSSARYNGGQNTKS